MDILSSVASRTYKCMILSSYCISVCLMNSIYTANYTFHPFHLSWKEAKLNCTKRQSSLASVDNMTSLNQLLNQSNLVLQDVWIGNVLSFEPMNGSSISNITTEELLSSDYQCVSIQIRRLSTDGEQWNYTFDYVPLPCSTKLPSVCLYRLSGKKRWMVQSSNFSWWKVTKNPHCLELWHPEVPTSISYLSHFNVLGNGHISFDYPVFELRRSYWIRKVLKVKQRDLFLSGDSDYIFKCGYYDSKQQIVRFDNCSNRKGFFCFQEHHPTLSTETTTSDDDHYDVYIGTALGILILAVCVTGAFIFVKKKKGLKVQKTKEIGQCGNKTRVWRKQTSHLSESCDNENAYSEVVPATEQTIGENEVNQCDATYDVINDDGLDNTEKDGDNEQSNPSSLAKGTKSISFNTQVLNEMDIGPWACEDGSSQQRCGYTQHNIPSSSNGYLQMDNHVSDKSETNDNEQSSCLVNRMGDNSNEHTVCNVDGNSYVYSEPIKHQQVENSKSSRQSRDSSQDDIISSNDDDPVLPNK